MNQKRLDEENIFPHGAIRVDKNKNYLTYQDGTPFFYLADTWWFALTQRTSFSDFKKLTKDRKSKGFNAVQLVVGIPPETDPFSKNAKNSGGFVFDRNWQLNKKYFDEADKKISFLINSGMVPCLVGGWGHHMDFVQKQGIKRLWKEIVIRYQKYPVIFCLAGEVDLVPPPGYGSTASQNSIAKLKRVIPSSIKQLFRKINTKGKRIENWADVASYIKSINTTNRPLTAHSSHQVKTSELFKNPKWLDIDTIQSGHDQNGRNFMVSAISQANKSRPIINMEPWYEGIQNTFGEKDQRFAFWASVLSGAKGHSYGAHGIWQMSSGDNFMGHWGKSDWKKAINFKGATQIGLAKKFLENYQWWKLKENISRITPHFGIDIQNFPITAQIGDEYIFIYFPDIKAKKVFKITGLAKKGKYNHLFINPATMKTVKKIKLDGKNAEISIQGYNDSIDLLSIIEKTK